jgi:DNA-binding NarL/FixJ family response regulator
MRVIVADNHPDVRSALRLLLEEKPGVNVTAEVSKAEDLVAEISSTGADLILLDWELPGIKTDELMSLVRSRYPSLSVIALSSLPQIREAALASGARYFVCKSEPPENLLAVIDKFILE